MKNLKVSIKLLLPHIVILLLLLAGIIVSLVSYLNIRKQTSSLFCEFYVVKNAVGTMNATFESMQKSIYCSILNNYQDITNEAITDVENSGVIIQEQVVLLKQNFMGDRDIIERLEQHLSELALLQEEALNLVSQNKNLEIAEYMENHYTPAVNDVQNELAMLMQEANAKENDQMVSLRETQRNVIILLVGLGVAGVLFSIGVGIYIRRLQKKGRQNMFIPDE